MKRFVHPHIVMPGVLIASLFIAIAGKVANADGLLMQLYQRCSPSYDTRSTHPIANGAFVGDWHWSRSPEQEKRVVVALFNRYCSRCHGVDGKGVWDIPDVPDFTNGRWQQCRSDEQIVRLIIEGRGACMPAFRGTLSIEETWAMSRYLRTFGVFIKCEAIAAPNASTDKDK
ncbi:MAG TPA: cytochrome c [Pirellula sp.]|nr:cytochrome c [Pirellula sp.]